VVSWTVRPPAWSWGTFEPEGAFSLKEPIVVSAEFRLSQLSPNLCLMMAAKAEGADGSQRDIIRYKYRGGADQIDERSDTPLIWSRGSGERPGRLRLVEFFIGPREVALVIDGEERFRTERPLGAETLRLYWGCGFKLDRAPASIELRRLAVRRAR
jgi:hypothetical protein